jgi:hypothetical protein
LDPPPEFIINFIAALVEMLPIQICEACLMVSLGGSPASATSLKLLRGTLWRKEGLAMFYEL